MEQPKFKFGDKVYYWASESVFIVTKVRFSNGRYYYHPEEDYLDCVEEDDLELYQPPKTKKLYAYKNDCTVEFKTIDNMVMPKVWERAPEYDIEYPEVKE